MADKKVSFGIYAENKTDSAFDKAAAGLKKLAGNVDGSSKSLGGLKNGIKNAMNVLPIVGFATVAVASLKKVAGAALEAEEAFSKVEQSEKRLDFAARLNTKLGSSSTALKKFAAQLNADLRGTLAGGDILAAISPLAFDKSATQIKQLSTVAADLSAALGKDLTQSLNMLQASLTGEVGELKKVFPELTRFTKEQLAAGAAVEYVGQKVKGTGAAMAESAAGSLARYRNAMGDLKEEFGGAVTGFFQPARDWLSSIAEGWRDALAAKREYLAAKEAEKTGTADADQRLALVAGSGSDTVRMKAFQSNIEEAIGKRWDDSNSQEQFSYLKLISYFLDNRENPRAGMMNEQAAQGQFGLDTASVQKAFSAFLAQYERTSTQGGMLYTQELTKELAGFKTGRTVYEDARSRENQQNTATEAEERRKATESASAELLAQALKMGLDATVLRIQNRIASGEIDKVSGEKQISDLTDDKFLAALKVKQDAGSNKEQVHAATQYLAAYGVSWKIKAQQADEARRKELDEEAKKEAEARAEYTKSLNDIIRQGLSPAQAALAEFNDKNGKLLSTLSIKLRSGTASESESRAAFVLGGQKQDLEKAAADEAKKPGMMASLVSALSSGSGTSEVGALVSGAAGGGLSAILGPLGAALGPLGKSFSMITQILNPMQTIFAAMFEVLAPVVESLLAPLLGILKVLGMFLGNMLVPVFRMLEPVITLITEAFVWLYNYVLLPVGNGIMGLFVDIGNFFIGIMNGIIDALNHIPYVDINRVSNLQQADMQKINAEFVTNAGANTTGSNGSGGGATYSGAKDVYINFYFDRSYVNGDAREIALALREEIRQAEAMGY